MEENKITESELTTVPEPVEEYITETEQTQERTIDNSAEIEELKRMIADIRDEMEKIIAPLRDWTQRDIPKAQTSEQARPATRYI